MLWYTHTVKRDSSQLVRYELLAGWRDEHFCQQSVDGIHASVYESDLQPLADPCNKK